MTYFFEGKILAGYILIYACFLILYGIRRKKTELLLYALCGVLFGIYLYFVIRITQFPIMQTPGMEEALGGNMAASVHLVPFADIVNRTSLYNIILTLPMGFFIPLLCRKKLTKSGRLLLFFLPGLLIELLQLAQLLVIGYTLRVVDVNDLICNAAGTAAGYLVFHAVRKGIADLNRRPKREKGRLAEYFTNR